MASVNHKERDSMPAPKKPAKGEPVKIPALKIERFNLRINGTTPLIVHAWSQKAIAQMLGKQKGEASLGREDKKPFQDFLGSLYWLDKRPPTLGPDIVDATPEAMKILQKLRFGFPARGIKAAAVDAAVTCNIAKTEARRAFHIEADLVEIHGTLSMREDIVRVGMGTADVRHRGQFDDWHMILPIKYRPDCLSASQIVNLFSLAGFSTGLGEWRVEKDGDHGMFEVAAKVA
jgi:hypothetical protein